MQTLFATHFARFAASRKLTADMNHAAWALRHCRTRELGGHVNSCPEGHYHKIAYNSCLHRSCPQCSWLEREKWLAGWNQRLLDVPHHHIVFTVAHELLPLWRFNKATFANVLFAAASETLLELLQDPKYLGGRPGILAALHTWNQKLQPHVHLHVLVTAGGLDGSKQWAKPQKSCLLPRKVLMIKFRGKFKARLRQSLQRNELKLPTGIDRSDFSTLLWRSSQKNWNVKIHDAYDHGRGVTTYLARYIKGGPIGNSRLIEIRDGRVLFRYRLSEREGGDGRTQKVTSLEIETFLSRWLEHVPPRRFQTIRGYGLYSCNQHSRLDVARECLGQCESANESTPETWQQWCEAAGMREACCCPKCGKVLESHSRFPAGRGPPASAFRRRPNLTAA